MSSSLHGKRIFFLVLASIIGVGMIGIAVYASRVNAEKTNNQGTVTVDTSKTANTADVVQSQPQQETAQDLSTNTNTVAITGTSNRTGDTEANQTDNTQTGQISRALFASFMAAKESGTPIDQNAENQIISQALSGKVIGVPAKEFTQSDIKIAAVSDFKKYANDLGVAMYAGASSNTASEIEILNDSLTKNDKTEIEKLDPIIANYSKILNGLLTISVPKESATAHLALLNSTSRALSDIKAFRIIYDDPVVSMAAIGSYQKDMGSLQTALRNIKSQIDSKGIAFGANEYAQIFFRTIQ